jgi:hypothetical protein
LLTQVHRTETPATQRYASVDGNISWQSDQPGTKSLVISEKKGNQEKAFDRLVALKISTSNVSMHLDEAWRAGLFAQLDNMLDPQEWDFSDEMPSTSSFMTFLRMIIHNRVVRRPGLGATTDGKIIAAWTAGHNRLTVECLPDDKVRWVAVKYVDGERVSGASSSPVALLRTFLAPFQPELWFG